MSAPSPPMIARSYACRRLARPASNLRAPHAAAGDGGGPAAPAAARSGPVESLGS